MEKKKNNVSERNNPTSSPAAAAPEVKAVDVKLSANPQKKHLLPALPYAYNALEPYMDEATVKLHHDKHHQAYVDNLNLALDKHPELYAAKLDALLRDISKVPEDIRVQVKNHGGGVWNHNFFWLQLKKDVKMPKKISEAINKEFGSFESFKEKFSGSAKSLFGSGWTWLVVSNGKLEIINLPNQDSPLSIGKIPILTIDMWEHSFYLLVQNRKPEYISNFFNLINWEVVEKNYEKALKGNLPF